MINEKELILREKYKWHDLRKNPDDLPEHYECVLVMVGGCVDVAVWAEGHGFRPWYSAEFECCTSAWESPVVAWKHIEPFEDDDR